MDTVAVIHHYFPELTVDQFMLFDRLKLLYTDWNAKVNLISRKDIGNIYLHHVLHALAIAKVIRFVHHTDILDFGSGGGFPGLPLAIFFPAVHFHLIDAKAKKVRAVEAMVATLGLQNVTLTCMRGEILKTSYDFVVGRAVANVKQFYKWAKDKVHQKQNNSLPNGILYLTGPCEVTLAGVHVYPLRDFFTEMYFQEKYLIHMLG